MAADERAKSPVFHLLGHPVGHSLSPVIHAAAYEALGRQASYRLTDCPDRAAVESEVSRLRVGEIAGLNVTVPHKKLALELADERDPSAERVQAANVLARTPAGRVRAYNTDAPALAAELRALTSRSGGALVLGTGGAALAALVSAALAGFSPLFVSGRRYVPQHPRASWPEASHMQALGAQMVAWPSDSAAPPSSVGGSEFDQALDSSVIVIQATSAGMKGADSGEDLARALRFSPNRAHFDLVYNPATTPFLREARRVGAPAEGGLGMLVRQAALAIEIWWGVGPELGPLRAAALRELALRESAGRESAGHELVGHELAGHELAGHELAGHAKETGA